MKTTLGVLFLALLGAVAATAAQPRDTSTMHDDTIGTAADTPLEHECDCLTEQTCEEKMTMATCDQCKSPMQPSAMPGVEQWCPDCGAILRADFARAAYEAYAGSTGGKTFDGRDMPQYGELPTRIVAAWEAATHGAHQARVNERAKVTAGLTFGDAVERLKSGARVSREGWNGKGMWLVLIHPGNAMHTSSAGAFDMQPCIGMKTAGNVMQPGWLASQADMLADDWQVVTS